MSYADILKDHFERAQGKVMRWYDTAARWVLLAYIILYLAACIVAGGMVGPVRYIEFIYHCSHWQEAQAAVKQNDPAPVPQITKPRKPPRHNPESSF